jgi:hypothetical protein
MIGNSFKRVSLACQLEEGLQVFFGKDSTATDDDADFVDVIDVLERVRVKQEQVRDFPGFYGSIPIQ